MQEILVFDFQSDGLVFAVAALVLLASSEVGFRIGRRARGESEAERSSRIGGVQAAVLGLLGLLLGFTFAMAVNRHDARRDLIVKEANAIGTTWLRADLLPAAHVEPVRELLRSYVELRLRYGTAVLSAAALERAVAESGELHRRLWSHAVAASRESATPPVALFVQSLNATIDAEAERLGAFHARIPVAVWLIVLVVGAFGCLVTSYATGAHGRRSVFTALVLPLLVVLVITLILDLASPRRGFIGLSNRPFQDLLATIERAPGG